MKPISYHRIISFLITRRTIQSYEKFVRKSYRIGDTITGTTFWCDFFNQHEWGECTNAFQNFKEAEYLHKNLFEIDIEAIEKEFCIKIDSTSIPSRKLGITRGYAVNTIHSIKKLLEKKLNRKYPYLENGYSAKGILILGIFDPAFSGFTNDFELNPDSLDKLKQEVYSQFMTSSFEKVLLIDVLSPFQHSPNCLIYELFSLS